MVIMDGVRDGIRDGDQVWGSGMGIRDGDQGLVSPMGIRDGDLASGSDIQIRHFQSNFGTLLIQGSCPKDNSELGNFERNIALN